MPAPCTRPVTSAHLPDPTLFAWSPGTAATSVLNNPATGAALQPDVTAGPAVLHKSCAGRGIQQLFNTDGTVTLVSRTAQQQLAALYLDAHSQVLAWTTGISPDAPPASARFIMRPEE